jgi:hypothetical protein
MFANAMTVANITTSSTDKSFFFGGGGGSGGAEDDDVTVWRGMLRYEFTWNMPPRGK